MSKIATIFCSKFVLLPIKRSLSKAVYQKQRQGSLIRVVVRKSEELVKYVCFSNRSSHLKLLGSYPTTLLRSTSTQVYFTDFAYISRTCIFLEYLQYLILYVWVTRKDYREICGRIYRL